MIRRQRKVLNITAAIFIFIISIITTGCYDQREIDDMAYPMALGIDIGEADKLRITLQMASPLSIGGGGGGDGDGGKGGGGESTSIITVDTPSIYSGLNLVNNIISKEINMSHAKAVIISRKLAERGVSEYIHALLRGREFRSDVFIAVSNDPPDEYLKNVKPTLESNPSKYYELMLGKNFASFYPSVRMRDFYSKSESDSSEPVAILTGVSKYENVGQLKNAVKNKSAGTSRPEGNYEAGNIPVISKQKNEVMGAAVFRRGKMAGTLNGEETICYQMVTGNYKHSYWTLPDPYDNKKIIVLDIYQRRKPCIKADITGGKVTARIKLDFEVDITSVQSTFNYEDQPQIVEQHAERILEEEIRNMLVRTRDEFNSDICGIGNYVKGKFLTWYDWKKFNWLEQYKFTSFDVDVKLNARRTGLMIRSVR